MSSEVWLNGLPPVGCECEYEYRSQWRVVFIIGNALGGALIAQLVFSDLSNDDAVDELITTSNNPHRFRPLKTKEQTEREEAINNVCNDLGIMLGTSHDRIDAAIDSMLKLGYHNDPKMGEVVGVPQTRNLWRESDYNSYDVFIARNFTIIKKEEL